MNLPLDFVATLIATLIGVYVAFRLGVRHERQKKEEDNQESLQRWLTAIKEELQKNLALLNELDKNEVYRGNQMFLLTDVYQSAVYGGDLNLLDPQLQGRLGFVYVQFKQLDTYGQKLIDLEGIPAAHKTDEDFVVLMKDTTKRTLKFIPMAIAVVDAELMKAATKEKKNEYLELLRKEPTTTKEDLQLMFSADWNSDTSFYLFVVGLLLGSLAGISQILATSSNVLTSIQLLTYWAELVVVSGVVLYAGLSRFGLLTKIRARRLHAYIEARKTFESQI